MSDESLPSIPATTIVPPTTTSVPCAKDWFPTHELIPCDQWTACPNVVSAGGVPSKYFPEACSPFPTYPKKEVPTVPVTTPCPPGVPWNAAVGSPGWCGNAQTGTVPQTIVSTAPVGSVVIVEETVATKKIAATVAVKKTQPTLPQTGSSDVPLPAFGLGFVLVGAILIKITRRRAHCHTTM